MSLTKATNSMINGASVNVLDYGADPTGVADSLAAFNAAVAAGDQIVIPVGTYKLTGTWSIPSRKSVYGLGYSSSSGEGGRPKLVPTSAVTGAAIDLEGTANWLQNIYVDGTATSGVIGLRIGNVPLANLCFVTYVECDDFTGSGAKGLQLINTVGTYFHYCRFNRNQEGVDIGTLSASSLPTTTVFNECWFRESTGVGVVVRQNFQLTFSNCLWEANFQSGMNVDGNGYVCVGIQINGGWAEDNWRSLTPPARTAEAHFNFVGAGGDVENITVNNTLFSGDATSERAIKASTIYDLLINSPITSTSGGANMIQTNNCTGWIQNWRYTNTTGWGNTGGSMQNLSAILEEWTDWTPTYTPAGLMTFTGVTTTTARYKKNGKTFVFELNVSGTTGGVAASSISFTLPSGVTTKNSSYLVCYMDNNGTGTVGYARFDGTNTASLYKIDGGNFSLGTTRFTGSFTIEID